MDSKKLWEKVDGDWVIKTTNILTKSISTIYDINKEKETFPYKQNKYYQSK